MNSVFLCTKEGHKKNTHIHTDKNIAYNVTTLHVHITNTHLIKWNHTKNTVGVSVYVDVW